MRRPTCSRCQESSDAKMAAHYWAYRDAADVRSAWRQLVCYGCIAPSMAIVKANREGYDGCLQCGQTTLAEDALHTIWLTLYLPGQAQGVYQLDVCDDCLEPTLSDTRANSKFLPDRAARSGSERGAPHSDPWAAFGVEPVAAT